jgi:Saccharopine dehydrogenase NADP binding domain
MHDQNLIGIIGSSGAVGRAAVHHIRAWWTGRLRVGGRRLDLARRVIADELNGASEAVVVDVYDPASLSSFCAGCRIVVNCAGPSSQILDRVAWAALAAGADYVDTCGNEDVYERLADHDFAASNRTALLSAGLLPGLSGLLPRCLAQQGFRRTTRLEAYVGGLDRFTPAAARDYLFGLGRESGEPLASWRNCKRVPHALSPKIQVELPYFPRRVDAYPFLSRETERLALALGLGEVDWYSVFDGTYVLAAVRRWIATEMKETAAVAQTHLMRAAELDLAGRAPYYILLFQLDGEADGQYLSRTMVMRGSDVSALTGYAAAQAVLATLQAEVAPGLHYAAEVLRPGSSLDRLISAAPVSLLKIFDGSISGAVEIGAL